MSETKHQKTAVIPGFFDPFTLGHQNIVERASALFDHVIVSVTGASPKQQIFDVNERVEMIEEVFRGNSMVTVERFDGLLVDYLREKKIQIVIRGIRTVADFEYELQMSLANKKLWSEMETFFMMTDSAYSFLSSTLIREIAKLGGETESMVPDAVARRLKEKYGT